MAEFEEGKQNLLDFIQEKINNFKSVLKDLSNDKEKFNELEKTNEINKSKIMLAIMFMNENNKDKYIKELMEKCNITNNESNYNLINSYFDLLFEIKSSFLNAIEKKE